MAQSNRVKSSVLSAIVEPYLYNSTGRTAQPSHFIKIDGPQLRELIDNDCVLGCIFLRQISVALTERLMDTRVQLAAAWVDSQKAIKTEPSPRGDGDLL